MPTAIPSTFAVYLRSAIELPWFTTYVRHMVGTMFRPADSQGARPVPAWDHWLRVGVTFPADQVIPFVRQLPPSAHIPKDCNHIPTEGIGG